MPPTSELWEAGERPAYCLGFRVPTAPNPIESHACCRGSGVSGFLGFWVSGFLGFWVSGFLGFWVSGGFRSVWVLLQVLWYKVRGLKGLYGCPGFRVWPFERESVCVCVLGLEVVGCLEVLTLVEHIQHHVGQCGDSAPGRVT